ELLMHNQIDDDDVDNHDEEDGADHRPDHPARAFFLPEIQGPAQAPDPFRDPDPAVLLAEIQPARPILRIPPLHLVDVLLTHKTSRMLAKNSHRNGRLSRLALILFLRILGGCLQLGVVFSKNASKILRPFATLDDEITQPAENQSISDKTKGHFF